MRIYPDSCVLIYLVEDRQPWSAVLREKLQPSHGPLPTLVFSELTRLECRVHPLKSGDADRLRAFDCLFANRGYQTRALDREVFEEATRLRVEHGLKTPDALHLATALAAGCEQFWTNDQRLQRAALGRIDLITF